ncbi:hypothetical protein [Pedobacter alluvionis]|jgi:hypothetical protein|uniref:Uncharacterized protein n=1 Tax=Pedobacter alluvionis TaxID=475253 RepID=A0A497XUZ2_9SPHI|nr:hypothetical protein [Pedobacter alluvionis]RLJ73434.1 hypothetical protein BCL90_3591 [Pedobacter alluvionis]TFB32926.1 hypothetical protein E3V97_02480 [Pedobacter alluvionis]
MRAFRILLALAVAAGTFYSLNVLAIQHGYRDRLDFKNRYYHDDCQQEHYRNHSYSHHSRKMDDTMISPADSINQVKR